MAIAIASAVIMLALLDRAVRLERIVVEQLKARFELYAIRDDLRRLERRGAIPQDRWFSYLDTTLTRAAAAIEDFTIWHALAYLVTVSGVMTRINEAEQNRMAAMRRVPELEALYARYSACLTRLIRERHRLLWRALGLIARTFHGVRIFRAKLLALLKGSPETSTLLDYACHV